MEKASISRIFIEYKDGSYDTIETSQDDPEFILYGLERNNSRGERTINGAYTSGAIAALLFITAITNQHTEYRADDPKIGALMEGWRKVNNKKD